MSIAPISVVIPCYCCSQVLPRAVDSVLRQSLLPAEIILVDDASPDQGETRRCIEEIVSGSSAGSEVRIRSHYLEYNQGPGGARNAAWDIATKPYIAFLDADDAWHPQKIEYQFTWMIENPDYCLSGHSQILSKDGSVDWKILPVNVKGEPLGKFKSLLSNPFATRTVMLKRNLPFRFKEGKRYIEDYLLWLQIILSGIPAAYLSLPLAATYKDDFGAGGLSAQLWRMELGELDAYWQIYKDGLFRWWILPLVITYSMLKHFRRVLIVAIRRLMAKSK